MVDAGDQLDSGALSQIPQSGVGPEGVIFGYWLFLGRGPENDAVVSVKTHCDVESLALSFIESSEFDDRLLSPVVAGRGPEGWSVDGLPRDFHSSRLARSLGLHAAWLQGARAWPEVFQDVFNSAISRQALDDAYGSARAEAFLNVVAAIQSPEAQLESAYQVFLGRDGDDTAYDGASSDSTRDMGAARRAAEFLRSPEFWTNTAEPVLTGALPARLLPSVGTEAWGAALSVALGLPPPSPDRARALLLADIAAHPDVTRRLRELDAPWSPAALVDGLRRLTPPDRRGDHDAPAADALDYIRRITTGATVLSISDLDVTAQGALRSKAGDPYIILNLAPESRSETFCEVTFSTLGSRARPLGALYLDYGSGFEETSTVLLTPEGRNVYGAVLASPAELRTVRWDPDDVAGQQYIVGIWVSPLASSTLAGRLSGSAPENVLLSRTLTHALHGYPMEPPRPTSGYDAWMSRHEGDAATLRRRWTDVIAGLAERPLISVVTPVYNTPEPLLRAMIESVRDQVYPEWELCLADDASSDPNVARVLEAYAREDSRIKIVRRKQNGHISAASNSAMKLATGDWVAMLDHDDVLAPHALAAVAAEIDRFPNAQIIYSDEDKLDETGSRCEPHFKPDYSPDLLRAQNYFNHLTVHRAANIRAVGGWREGFEGSQDFDLNLRVVERVDPSEVRHIPLVLYHWRAVEGSTALDAGEKTYALEASRTALREHLTRTGARAEIDETFPLPFNRLRYSLPTPAPRVSVIIPTRDRADILSTCLDSVLNKTQYPDFEILVVDNGSVENKTFDLFRKIQEDKRVRVISIPGPFNYSHINNLAVKQSSGQIIGLVNNDVEVVSPEWMLEMASWAIQPWIGCVGAKLYYSNDTIQHAGVIVGLGGVAGHSHKHFPRDHPGYFHRLQIPQNLSAVTAACLFVRREVFDEVGGLDEQLMIAFNDVDFCLRVRKAGYLNLFTPFAELYHHESVSRGAEDDPAKVARFTSEIDFMKRRWGENLVRDPYYSPNLTLDREDFSIGA